MTQNQALSIMLSGNSVFLTGAPGAGKTYVLNRFVSLAKKRGLSVAVTASTGIAATHIGGTTIHSWSGLGIRDSLNSGDLAWLSQNARLVKRYNAVDVLVIDEISMLHGARLNMVNQVCKLMRQNSRPFGGIQVILVGDLFQLPPVKRGGGADDFVHLSSAWAELNPKICYLTEQHRQKGGELLEVLEAMRSGELSDYHSQILSERMVAPDGHLSITKLFSHNVDVDTINYKKLFEIDAEVKTFEMVATGAKGAREQLMKSVLAPQSLELKIGAEVMFVANNHQEGFVNGSRGQISGFTESGSPIVTLYSGKQITVKPHAWSLSEDGKIKAEVEQLPLRLAWAITIHKSQGMSLDAAEVDLSRSFTPGMGYVALSRVRSLDGLYLRGLNRMALTLHPAIFEFDDYLRRVSAELSSETTEFVEVEEEDLDESAQLSETAYDKQLFEQLRAWRLTRARADNVAPFIIAHDSLLKNISRSMPTNQHDLLALDGIGPKKLELYGQNILEIVRQNIGE
jgi:ATP-dependent exoDNAse (exonuclease V) alpha subunit